MNKKIIKNLALVILVAGITTGITFAFFIDQAKVEGNVFATGNADLEIRLIGSGQGWANIITGVNWESLYPGWSESYDIQLRNESNQDIALNIIPKSVIDEDDGWLQGVITLQFFNEEGEAETSALTLEEWGNNELVLEQIAAKNEGEIWTLEFSFPTTGENQSHLQNKEIKFDLIFDGVQEGGLLNSAVESLILNELDGGQGIQATTIYSKNSTYFSDDWTLDVWIESSEVIPEGTKMKLYFTGGYPDSPVGIGEFTLSEDTTEIWLNGPADESERGLFNKALGPVGRNKLNNRYLEEQDQGKIITVEITELEGGGTITTDFTATIKVSDDGFTNNIFDLAQDTVEVTFGQ